MKSPVLNKMNTVFIHVTDLEKSAKWYCDLLGQSFNKETVELPVFNLLIDGYTGLTLDAGPSGNKHVQPSPHPIFNFHTKDIQSAYAYIMGLGYHIESDIVSFDDFSFFQVKDPDENVIMVCTG